MKKLLVTLVVFSALHAQKIYWGWEQLDSIVESVELPKGFLVGCGTAELQISGADNLPNCQWASWERAGKVPPSGTACNSLHKRSDDIALLKKMGMQAYRFSVDWSLIEPEEGTFNEEALTEYRQFTDDLIAAGIKPVVTLLHFVHPQWFEDKGSFEIDENINYFVRFSKKVFETLGNRVFLWCTINEPTVYPFQAYIRGVWPPGKKCHFLLPVLY